MRQAIVIILLFAGMSALADTSIPERKFKKLTVDNAVKALNSATSNDYLSAVYRVLKSKLSKEEKEAVILKLFSSRKKLEMMRKQGEGNSRDIYLGLSLVAKHLKSPSEIILKLVKSELYNPTKEEDLLSWELRHVMIVVVRDMPKVSREIVMYIAKLPGDTVGGNRLGVIVRHGDDELVRKTLDRTRSEAAEDQRRWYPEQMRTACHRPLVFKYLVDSYLKYEYPSIIYLILTRDENRRLKYSAYANVSKEDAGSMVNQVDRILAVKSTLMTLKNENNRLDDEDIGDLVKVRKFLERRAKGKK